ncbi:TetR/AcrR family transcriptional regulator [Microcella sp.]|uniref:TetR/AcrR family transcriptional regulator n=1 Tax=Microcella sp. TaxID=1913979 RepID=UPI00299F54ED|nr:TetR/AcrR family transcriptional regulator [Microcella sp.]MDX2026088.1 TetR/AcrR family transcriptional regulator [Microcella sp.]
MTTSPVIDFDVILDAASDIVTNDGYQAVTLASIASRCGASTADVANVFPTANDAMVAMLTREFAGMYGIVVQNIERDPRGGLLSRVYTYMLSAVYERPLAKTLFVVDRDSLGSILRNTQNGALVPTIAVRAELIESLQDAGMVRTDVDAHMIASVLAACSAGLALTAPHDELDHILDGLSTMLARAVDADVADTSPGKAIFYDWASRLSMPTRDE